MEGKNIDQFGSSHRYSFVWAALTSVVAIFAFFFIFKSTMQPLRQLAAAGVRTQGRIVAKGGQNPNLVHYTFSVGGKIYKNVGRSGYGMPEFEKLKVNDKVPVFYNPANPQTSMLGNPKLALESKKQGLLIMPFFLSTFLMVQLMWRSTLPRYKREFQTST